MAGSYIAGRASIIISPSLAKNFRQQLQAELKKIGSQNIQLDADLDTGEVEEKLDNLQRGREAKIGVDADTAGAAAKIENAAQNRETTINADADTAAANSKLLALTQRPRRVEINVDLDGLARAAAQLQIMNRIKAGGYASSAAFGFSSLALAAGAAVGPLTSLASLLVQASGALAVIPGAAFGAAAGFSSLAVGLSGIGDTFKEAAKNNTAAADAAKNYNTAIKQVEAAEKQAAAAVKQSNKAQEELNKARQQAQEDLDDLADKLQNAAFNEEDAAIAVARAKQRLEETNAGSSTELDRREADLAYRKAVANLQNIREENTALQQQYREQQAAGVEGSERVLAAKENLLQAVENEKTAQENLAETVKNIQTVQEENNQALQQAEESFNKLAPAAQSFVKEIQALQGAWDGVRLSAQQALFDGLGNSISRLATVQLPVLRQGLAEMNTSFNGALKDTTAGLATAGAAGALGEIFNSSAQGLKNASQNAAPLAQAILNFGAASAAFLPQIGLWMNDITVRFSGFLNRAATDGSIGRWAENGFTALNKIKTAFLDITGIFSGVFGALNQTTQPPAFLQLLDRLNAYVNSEQGQSAIITLFNTINAAAANLAPILGVIGQIVVQQIIPAMAGFVSGAAPGVNAFFVNLGAALSSITPLMPALGQAFGQIAAVLGQVLAAAAPLIAEVLERVIPYLPGLIAGITGLFAAGQLVGIISNLANVIKLVVGVTNPWLAVILGVGAALVYAYQHCETFRNIVNALKDAFLEGLKVLETFGKKVIEVGGKVKDFFFGKKQTLELTTIEGAALDGVANANGSFNYAGDKRKLQPGIYGAGSYVLFAEKETGGEAYIPFAPDKRKRSTAILAKTADLFGYQIMPKMTRFASGGITGYTDEEINRLAGSSNSASLTKAFEAFYKGMQEGYKKDAEQFLGLSFDSQLFKIATERQNKQLTTFNTQKTTSFTGGQNNQNTVNLTYNITAPTQESGLRRAQQMAQMNAAAYIR